MMRDVITVLLATVSASPALAQTLPAAPSTEQGEAQSGPARATTAAQATSTGGGTQEIIVTAQKRAQNVQDVPASISAITGAALQEAGITDVQDLQAVVPNITIGTSFGYANLFMRGLGLNSVFANVDPSVTLYEDGAVISQPAAQLFSFFDLERVEVLRGPQGTLYGRNATGGTINLIAAKPTDKLTGFVRAQYGNYNALESEGAVSGPLSDTVSARLAYFVSDRDGYGKNLVTGTDINDYSVRAGRAQIRFRPTSEFEFLLAGEYGREKDRANALQFKREAYPDVLTDANPANDNLVAVGRGGFPTGDPRDYASTVDPDNFRETWSITGTARYEVSDAVSITNILNYRKFDMVMHQDLDLSAVPTSSIQEFSFDNEHWSEEFQVNVDLDRFNAVAGFYYFSESLVNVNAVARAAQVGEFNPAAPGGGKRVHLRGEAETDTWALYWNASFDLTDQITIRGGGRFTNDKRSIDNENYVWVPSAGACAGSGGSVSSGSFADAGNPANVRVECYIPGPDDKRTFKDYTNEAGVQWRPNDDVMLYYTYSEGFKAGTGQIGTSQLVPPFIIDPETIRSHEIGLKSSLFDNRLVLNAAAFSYKINDVQLDRALPGGATGFITVWENATTQKAQGIEIDASWRPSSVFRGNASLAILDTEFGSFTSIDPINPALLPVDIEGNRARNAPEFAGSIRMEYDIPTANGGIFTLTGAATHKSKRYFIEFNNDVLQADAFTLFDASVRYTFPGDQLTVSVYVNNITDKLVEGANAFLATGRVVARTFLPPRTFGANVAYRF